MEQHKLFHYFENVAKRCKEKECSVVFRWGHPFTEFEPEFVIKCIEEARKKCAVVQSGIDELSPLEKLGLYALAEAEEVSSQQ